MKWILYLFILFGQVFAFGVSQGDTDYLIQKESRADFIFPAEYEKSGNLVSKYLDEIFKEYDQSFHHYLNKKPTVILASNHNQIANATATVIPNSIMTWYGGGASGIDYFNSPSWAETLALHETAHIYQMDAKEPFGEKVEDVLGTNALPLFAPYLPVWFFTAPNTTLPDFFLEGNAVFNESRFGVGGRMYGGRHRALFLSLLKDNKLNFTRLLNNHDEFPFLEEKYIVGGYFFTYLESVYGTDRVNRFFIEHSKHWFNPFDITSTCYEVFGKSYHRLIYDFLVSYVPMAQNFTKTKGKLIGKSLSYAPFGKSEDTILIYMSNLVTAPKILKLKDGNAEVVEGDFLTGKPFLVDDKIYTIASSIVEKSKVVFSLFDENRKENKKFRDKIVQDIQGDKILYFRGDLFGDSKLYENGKALETINSSAMYDESGNIYFFKQENSSRVLYKNSKKLLEFSGYDSKVVDIKDEEVYFTAPTIYGNGLYSYSLRGVERLGVSDDILDGKKVGDNLFLLNIVTSTGYEYVLANLKPFKARPSFWSYGFERDDKKIDTHGKEDLKEESRRSYNMLRDMKYNSLYPYYQYLDYGGYVGQITASFSDPLQQNTLGLSYFEEVQNYEDETLKSKISGGTLSYVNQKYIISLGLSYTALGKDSVDIGERDYQLNAYINYPFINNTRERLDTTLQHYDDQEDEDNSPNLVRVNYTQDLKFPMAFFSKFYTSNTLYTRKNKDEKTDGLQVSLGYSPVTYLYFSGEYKYSKSNEKTVKLDKTSLLDIDIANFTMLDIPYKVFSDEISSSIFGARFPVNKGYYSDWFPVSLQDFVIYGTTENLDFLWNNTNIKVTENVIGLDLNLLFIHRYVLPFKVFYVENSEVEKEKRGKYMFILNTDY